ncbi:SusC/RagA family TonB-linked outer membrane protein [Autumnicola musiva]|uniref:SusC/RagA family TonB-linked outer membrane protein n=1 Tax=Autumnicola musiva TaxID=3075589 RepID=A0ABU3D4M4_9FLAO|nr:SusC/RagA family TonB-linked outer membrane protein [Zunongwangia sp. F117]MDT0676482.1 SusC/RagA family TonB-linked outer membrane protein [Zunongwangia sp. F117]
MKNNYSRLKWVALIILGGILFFLSKSANAATTNIAYFQQQEISGVVQDQKGQSIPGVTITVKNTTRGTVTNLNGEYKITAPANGTLVFSYIGFKTLEIPIDGRSEINIQLEENIASLGEVKINAGYYRTTESERTGSIAKVTGEDIEMQPIVNPLQALQGRMAGVEITQRGGAPGMAPTIRIRGQNSLRDTRDDNGNLPLYIIDGVPINSAPVPSYTGVISGTGLDPLNTIGLSNIESIEILKDADATAIYGSRGANGVVLITTKRGYARETEVRVRLYSGAGQASRKMNVLNTREYLDIREQAFENDGVELTNSNAYDLLLWDNERYTDWQEKFFGGTSEILNMDLSVNGGNENTSFRLGVGYHKEGTVFTGDFDYQKATAALQVNHVSDNEKFHIDLSLNYGADTNNFLNSVNSSLVYLGVTLPPNAPPIFNTDGSLNWQDWDAGNRDNPFGGLYNTSEIYSNNLLANASFSYDLLKNLKFKTNLGYTDFGSNELIKMPKRSYNPENWGSITARSTHSAVERNSWLIEPQLIFNKQLGNSELDVIIGATFQQNTNSRLLMNGFGYSSEAQIGNLMVAEDVSVNNDASIDYKYNALFARIGYNWQHKLFVNLTGRRDGSSRFGPDKRFANFGAVGAAWIFSEEKFIKDALPVLSFGKLRGSYGTTGNDQIGDYGYLDAYESTLAPGGLIPVQLFNPDYSWEVNRKLEAALSLGFLEDKINTEVSWYRNRSSNQLVGFPLPATTGFNSIQANLPAEVQNTGWEVVLSSTNISNQDFKWNTSFNISFPRNKLISFPNIEETSYANTYRVGQPLNIDLLYSYAGIDSETGYFTVEDINEDGSFDYQDRVIERDRSRKFFGGMDNTLFYKNFSAQFLWEFVKQEGIDPYFLLGNLGNASNQEAGAINNGNGQVPSQSIQAQRAHGFASLSDLSTSDASFLRLKTISLGYNLSNNLLNGLGLKKGRLFVTGQNLITITPYEGLDPQEIGIYLPVLRTITAGLELTF